MGCKKCNSERIADISGKCSDMCSVEIPGCEEQHDYVPRDMGIGGGDYIKIKLCLDCGQVQGEFPLPETEIEVKSKPEE